MIDPAALRATLRARPYTQRLCDVAAEANVSLDWLKKFSTGYAPAKQTNNLEKLARYYGADV